jgi:hypothetical protein
MLIRFRNGTRNMSVKTSVATRQPAHNNHRSDVTRGQCRRCGGALATSAVRSEVMTYYGSNRLFLGGVRARVRLCTGCSLALGAWILEAHR